MLSPQLLLFGERLVYRIGIASVSLVSECASSARLYFHCENIFSFILFLVLLGIQNTDTMKTVRSEMAQFWCGMTRGE